MSSVYSNQRPNPCNGCPDRYIACSDHCQKPEHLEWKEEQEKIRENRKNYRAPAWVRQESSTRTHK